MFKSVFLKYVSAFMLIITVSFAVVVLITLSVVGRYSAEAEKEDINNCVHAASAYVSSMMHGSHVDHLDELVVLERDNIIKTFDWMVLNADGAAVVLLDKDDSVLISVGNDGIIDSGTGVSEKIKNELSTDGEYFERNISSGMFSGAKLLEILSIRSESGEYLGAIAVCSNTLVPEGMIELIVKIILGAVLLVLLATLIAVYFISERVVAPLREISSAAKKFASGRFDARVIVRGNDEVSELARAFNQMAESLDNYDNMRNRFMSDVSHDLRSPMTSISGFIDGILDGVIPPEQHKYYLQVVSSEVKRLSRLVNSLLDLSRIQAGERKFNPVSFDVCEMARQILISFEQKIDAKHLDVEFSCGEDRMNVVADHDAIYQVFYNICDNAVKFSSEGGKLAISIDRIKGKKISVEVFNEGQGLRADELNVVFDRFYKSDKSRGLNKNGAGLGLFISKTIIDAHDERIWVESDYGKNCRFGFTLESE